MVWGGSMEPPGVKLRARLGLDGKKLLLFIRLSTAVELSPIKFASLGSPRIYFVAVLGARVWRIRSLGASPLLTYAFRTESELFSCFPEAASAL